MDKKLYYIVCNNSFVGNSMVFWRLDGRGYTTDLKQAEKFTIEDAEKTINCSDRKYSIYPCDKINSISTHTVDVQKLTFKPTPIRKKIAC